MRNKDNLCECEKRQFITKCSALVHFVILNQCITDITSEAFGMECFASFVLEENIARHAYEGANE